MTKQRYIVGDWFAVPLRDGGFAVGVVARASAGGVLLGYFFGPKLVSVPSLDHVAGLAAADAVFVCRFGHLGLRQGEWPLLGGLKGWEPSAWPMPVFVRYEELSGRSLRVFYEDQDPNRLARQQLAPSGEFEQRPTDEMFGAGAVELKLTELLR
jgi:Immunity protein 26